MLNLSIPICTFSYESMYYEGRYKSKASSPPPPKCGAGKSFLPYPPDSKVQLRKDNRCSSHALSAH